MCAENHDIVCLAKYLLVLEKYVNYKTAPKLSHLQLILDHILEPYYEKLTNVIWTKLVILPKQSFSYYYRKFGVNCAI